MGLKIDIESLLCPNRDKLIVEKTDEEITVHAIIVDEELDPIDCEFCGDKCVIIHTEDLTYMTLSISNLKTLISLIKKAEKTIDKFYENKIELK